MNTDYIDLSYLNLALTLLFVVVAIIFSVIEKLKEELNIIIATIRTAAQLLAVGFVLGYVFYSTFWWVILGTLVLMNIFAGFDAARKIGNFKAFWTVTLTITVTATITLSVLIFLVIRPTPWFEPAYMIALGGMVLGNTMNACSIFLGHMKEDLVNRKGEVEGLLAIGATARQAGIMSTRAALKQAITPVIDMMVVGIVFLQE
ncbi:MAG: ABC transporter permease [Caldisericia bacterium]